MILKKLSKILTFLLLITAFFLVSCKDDPVAPPQEDFAPARFNWRTKNIYYHGFAGLWAMDTNNIFLLNHYNRNLYVVSSGNTVMQYIGGYYLNDIKGLSNGEVYMFGKGFDGFMTLIKWNGGGFEYYPTNIFVHHNIYSVLGFVVNSGEIWLCSSNGISKFDGIKMKYYTYEDTMLVPEYLFLTNDNTIQYIGDKADTAHYQISLYEFRDTGFVRVYNQITALGPPFTALHQVNGYKFGQIFGPHIVPYCIKSFDGTSYSDYFCFNEQILLPGRTIPIKNKAGVNLQNMLFLVQTTPVVFGPWRNGILHWNGSKVSKEIALYPYDSYLDYDATILGNVNPETYLILTPDGTDQWNSILYIGTRK